MCYSVEYMSLIDRLIPDCSLTDKGWQVGARSFELIAGPLDGEVGTRSHFGIFIFGTLAVKMDDGRSMYGSMDMPGYFRSPFHNKILIYKYSGSMRYEFEGYE